MTVAELIAKLQQLPPDYTVGEYRFMRSKDGKFRPLSEVAVTHSTKRVSVDFELALHATLNELNEARVV
jgi:hypothetical protein